jgi:hypothetical protein
MWPCFDEYTLFEKNVGGLQNGLPAIERIRNVVEAAGNPCASRV